MIPLQDNKTGLGVPLWVIIIIALNIFIFYLELTSNNLDDFIFKYALIPSEIDFNNFPSWIRFFTSQFLHGGFLHIISNMWFLWIFGDNIEERFGPIFFPIFYLFSGALGNFLQYLFISNSDIPLIGASGAIAGVLGAYYAFYPNNRVKTLIPVLGLPAIITIPASLILFYWFVLQIVSGGFSIVTSAADVGGVAYFAHVGGFIAGLLIGRFFF